MKNKQTKLLKGWQKAIIVLVCIILVPIIALFTYAIIDMVKDSKKPITIETKKMNTLTLKNQILRK